MAFLYWLLPLIFLCSLIGTWMLRHYAVSRSILDVPNARSSHEVPTPRGGGVAVVVTFLAMLELVKEELIEIVQAETLGAIHVRARTSN